MVKVSTGLELTRAAAAVTMLESNPPESNTPTGTSATNLSRTESSIKAPAAFANAPPSARGSGRFAGKDQ